MATRGVLREVPRDTSLQVRLLLQRLFFNERTSIPASGITRVSIWRGPHFIETDTVDMGLLGNRTRSGS